MRINKEGLKIIKDCEGLCLTAYKCPAGVWTIGYGHTEGVKQGDKITALKATQLLRKDIKTYENYVNTINHKYNYRFTRNEFSALVSFAFNVGYGNLLNLIDSGKRSKEVIASKMLLYNKANGVTLQGLVSRRQKEHDLYLKGGTDG